MAEKVQDWLGAGVPEVWVVVPRDRSVTIDRHEEQPVVLTRDDEISLATIPGFRCAISRFFPPRNG